MPLIITINTFDVIAPLALFLFIFLSQFFSFYAHALDHHEYIFDAIALSDLFFFPNFIFILHVLYQRGQKWSPQTTNPKS